MLTNLAQQGWIIAGRFGGALVMFIGFWIASVILERTLSRVPGARKLDPSVVLLLGRTAKIAILTFGVVTALGTAGVNVSALVAGLGLTGFALGFALRDVLSNFLSGVMIMFYKPFRRGDHITVSGLEGTVSDIDLRYTTLQHESKRILIPNSTLFSNPIVVEGRSAAAE